MFLLACGACGGTAAQNAAPAIRVETTGAAPAAIVVTDVAAADLGRVRDTELTREQWTAILRVSVGEGQPAMLGRYEVSDNLLRFTPAFPLDPGKSYHVVFDPSALPDAPASSRARVTAVVALPASTLQPSTVVSQIYPSGDVVPENQLRLYIHFSAPMGLKGGLDYIRLLDDRGAAVVDPFLPLDTEFWNDDRTRYTVFFDPGRQKRGILPNQQMGRALVPGRRYTLVVEREWRDGHGLPLLESHRHQFRVGPADERPLDPSAWRITAPAAGTRDPLVVTFPEALDHGLLLRAMGVADGGQQPVAGDIRIDAHETRWSFAPAAPWRAGTYQLFALGMLEDLAGNRIGRAFEVDQFERTDRSSEPERTTVPFTIRGK